MSSAFTGSYGASVAQTIEEDAIFVAKWKKRDIEVWTTTKKGVRCFAYTVPDDDGRTEFYVYDGGVYQGERDLYHTDGFVLREKGVPSTENFPVSQPVKRRKLYTVQWCSGENGCYNGICIVIEK